MTEKCECGEDMYEVDGILMCCGTYCTKYRTIVEQTESDSLVYHREIMFGMKKTSHRIKYLLETKPRCRNYDDWDFLNFYWGYLIGFTPGMEYANFWKTQIRKFALPETVRRSHQLVCEAELKPIREFLKLAKGLDQHSSKFCEIQHSVKEYLKTTRLIPTDLNLIKKKLEKESAMFEAVITVKNEELVA